LTGLLLLLLIGGFSSLMAEDTPVSRCLTAIDTVKSFDVTLRLNLLVFPDSSNPEKPDNKSQVWATYTNRDAFAVGFGRRIETSIGDKSEHEVAQIEWKTAQSTKRPSASAINVSLPGLYYLEYVHPIVEEYFLTDLLRDPDSRISPFKTASDDTATYCFDVTNPKIRCRIRLWLDASHNCLPARLELYRLINDTQFALTERMQVDEYKSLADNIWVPIRATYNNILPVGPAAGRASSGKVMEVDMEHSSWNSVKDGKMFVRRSLPKANYSEAGWRFEYSPEALAMKRRTSGAGALAKPVTLIMRIVLIALLAAPLFALMKMSKGKKERS
jgi:hypothetical protein